MPLMAPGFVRKYLDQMIVDEVSQRLSKSSKVSFFFIHLYSNNGVFVYSSLTHYKALPSPKCLIWDRFERITIIPIS